MLLCRTGQQYNIPDDTKPIAGVRGSIERRTYIIINPLTSTPSSFLYEAGTEKIYNNNNNPLFMIRQQRRVCLLYVYTIYPCIVIFVMALHISHTLGLIHVSYARPSVG